MSTSKETLPSEKLTQTIRGRVEPAIKERVATMEQKIERTQSYIVRRAVLEFLDRHEKKKAA